MHPPSAQLLRALRKTITTPFPLRASTRTTLTRLPITTHRSNSNTSNPITRPQRITPRAHKTKPSSHDRGPSSSEQTQTDLSSLNVLGSVPAPTTAVDACLDSGFQLNNGQRVTGGGGVLLVNGEAFAWRPWLASASSEAEAGNETNGEGKERMLNTRGQLDLSESAWGILDLVWPRPDLLIIGTGATMVPLSLETKKCINALGVRVEVLDSRNAAAQFNLLATERGVSEVAAALVPIGWSGRGDV